jgi:hypothetical protein
VLKALVLLLGALLSTIPWPAHFNIRFETTKINVKRAPTSPRSPKTRTRTELIFFMSMENTLTLRLKVTSTAASVGDYADRPLTLRLALRLPQERMRALTH